MIRNDFYTPEVQGAYELHDLGSKNGSFVNGNRAGVTPLKDGDQVQVGSTTVLMFALRSELEELRSRLAAGRRVFAAGPAGDIVAVAPGRRPQRPGPASSALVVWRPQTHL